MPKILNLLFLLTFRQIGPAVLLTHLALFHQMAQSTLEGSLADTKLLLDNLQRRRIAVRHAAVALHQEIINILSISNKCILLLQAHRNVNTTILTQLGYTTGNLLAEVKSAAWHFTAMQESNKALVCKEEEAFRQNIINRTGNLITDF